MTMRLAARACVPLESTARCLIMSRGVGAHALYEKGSKDFCGGFRQIHRLLRKSPGTNALCTRPGLVAESLKAFGQSQSRPFRKANYADKSHGKEKTEEIPEALEVRDGEKDTQPTWNAQDQKPSGKQGSDWPDEMTKGEWPFRDLFFIANHHRETVNYPVASFQIDHSPHDGWKTRPRQR